MKPPTSPPEISIPAATPLADPDVRRIVKELGSYTIPDVETLKGVLADAFVLYDVENGKDHLSRLLALIEKRADQEVFSLIILDLAKFLQPRLQRLITEILDLQQQHTSAITASCTPLIERQLRAVQAIRKRIRELWAEAGIVDASGLQIVEDEICRQIRSDAAALARIEASDFSDVDRLVHERLSPPAGRIQ